jgi:hypothetical protein
MPRKAFEQICEEIRREREHQDRKWGGNEADDANFMSDWLRYISGYVLHANQSLISGIDSSEKTKVFLTDIRKITALGMACLESMGCPRRDI